LLISQDPIVTKRAKEIIASKTAEIEKSEGKLVEIDHEILEKWSKGKVIEFAKDYVRKQAETIEQQAEIIERETKLVRDWEGYIKIVQDPVQKETIEK